MAEWYTYVIALSPSIVILGLYLASYLIGKKRNKNFALEMLSKIAVPLNDLCDSFEKVTQEKERYQLVCRPSTEAPMKSMVVLGIPLGRPFFIAFIWDKIRKNKDKYTLSANLKRRPPFSIEIVSKKRKKVLKGDQDYFMELKELVTTGFLNEYFIIKTNNLKMATKMFSNENLLRLLAKTRNNVLWLSMREEVKDVGMQFESIFEYQEEQIENTVDLFLEMIYSIPYPKNWI
ncbi:MAG: hypothetical protein JXA54_07890 [Candidatus Heimdallarchaeota archaeon]|nr:hypothetical protein [Candidatus Heimdallarchaeota archaeon]